MGTAYLNQGGVAVALGGGSSGPADLAELAVAEGAVTVFPFTDLSGTAVTDDALGAKAGSTYGAGVTLNQAPPGDLLGAVDLAGSNANQRVNVASHNNDNAGSYVDTFTAELVAKIDGAGTVGDGSLATLFGINGTHRFLVNATTGAVTVNSGSGFTAAAGTVPVAGTWFHLLFAYDYYAATRCKLYVDGALKTISDGNGQILPAITTFLGYYDGSNYMMNGGLAFFAAYRYPLSAGQAAAHAAMAGL